MCECSVPNSKQYFGASCTGPNTFQPHKEQHSSRMDGGLGFVVACCPEVSTWSVWWAGVAQLALPLQNREPHPVQPAQILDYVKWQQNLHLNSPVTHTCTDCCNRSSPVMSAKAHHRLLLSKTKILGCLGQQMFAKDQASHLAQQVAV